MVRLEDLAPGILVKGVLPESPVAVTGVRWHGAAGIELNFADAQGHKDQILLCREHEHGLEIVDNQREWSFGADARLWRLAAAARSVELAAATRRGSTSFYGSRLVAHLRKSGDEDLAAAVENKISDPQFHALAAADADAADADLGAFIDASLTALGGRGTQLREGRFEIAGLPAGLEAYGPLPKIISFQPGGEPDAEFVGPDHGLARALTTRVLDEYGSLMRRGCALVTPGAGPLRACLLVEQAVGQAGDGGEGAWRQLQWVEVTADGQARSCPETSWWDMRLPNADEQARIDVLRGDAWPVAEMEEQAVACVVAETVSLHLESARRGREYIARRIGEELALPSNGHHNGNGHGHAVAAGLGERLQPILDAWLQAPLLPLPPEVAGGALLVSEELLGEGQGRAPNGTAVQVPDFDPPAPGAAGEAAAEAPPEQQWVEEEPAEEGYFAQIPGLLTPTEKPRPPRASPVSGTTHRPPILTQSRASRVPVDLQREWQAHLERLEILGVAVPAGVELVRRNPIDGGIGLWIPPGAFAMGDRRGDRDEKPMHQVHLEGYYIDLQPVTQAQYQHFVRETSHRDREWAPQPDADDHPVVGVSWEDAVAYCTWAQKRLPTEAEWEKAARGTDGRNYPWGAEFELGRASVLGRGFSGTAPVGNLPAGASPYGMLDMAGNVWEWVADYYAPDYYAWSPPHNPMGPDNGRQRVMRGGAWICHRRYLRCAKRERQAPDYRSKLVGFRCAT